MIYLLFVAIPSIHSNLLSLYISNVPNANWNEMLASSLIMHSPNEDGEYTLPSIVLMLDGNRYTTVGFNGARTLYGEREPHLIADSQNRMMSAVIERESQAIVKRNLLSGEAVLWEQTGSGGYGNGGGKAMFNVCFAYMVLDEDGSLPLFRSVFREDVHEDAVYVPRSEVDTTSTTTTSNKRTKSDLRNWFGTPTTTAGTPHTSSSTVRMVTPDNDADDDDDDKKTSAPCVLFDEEFGKRMEKPKKEE